MRSGPITGNHFVMSDPQILSTLRRKRDEIEAAIIAYESKIEDAKRDLAAVAATLRLFELTSEPLQFPAYAAIGRLWKRGEMVAVCREALHKEGPLGGRQCLRPARTLAAFHS